MLHRPDPLAQHLRAWFKWCADHHLAQAEVRRAHIELYARELSESRVLMNSTIAGILATLSVFFRFAQIDGYLPGNPAEFVKRPPVPRVSTTTGFSRSELLRVLDEAQRSSRRDHALCCIFGLNGLRIAEVLGAHITDLGRSSGYHTLRVRREKGGDVDIIPLAPRTSWAIDQCVYGRTTGPVFVNRDHRPMDRASANRIVKRLARAAGIHKRVSAHSFRHTFITLALDAGVRYGTYRTAVGHRDARQVSYYDGNKNSLPRNATHMVAAYIEGS